MTNIRDNTVQSVARSIAILKSFSYEEPELGVGQLSRRLSLPKSTVSRLLSTLEVGGLVAQNPETGQHRLGLDLIGLANNVLVFQDLRTIARPHLRKLTNDLRETINLTVMSQRDAVNIEQFVSPGRLIMRVGWVGRRMPAHSASSGKVILAYLPKNDLQTFLDSPLEALTPQTITDPQVLKAELMQVRIQGYATAFEELEEGLHALSAPLFDHRGRVTASVSISAPSYRLTRERIEEITPQVIEVCDRISQQIGYQPENSYPHS